MKKVWRLKPYRYPSHAKLRAEVFAADGFCCRTCGAGPSEVPVGYDGRSTVYTTERDKSGYLIPLHVDHVLALHNGGTNDRANLQTLCERCNCSKGHK
jgi:5-methylcytosine-specific restriction endonuclease McrA